MAAPVVQSTSNTAVANSAASQTVTKPSGVAVGDFLVIVAGIYGYSGATTPTCTGFTTHTFHGTTVGEDNAFAVLTKTADSSDVSASNYTVNAGSASEVGPLAMFRISGSANSIVWSGLDGAAVTRGNDQVLIMVASYGNGASYTDFSGYTITAADANPSWTEVIDDDYRETGNINFYTFGCAYASTTHTSDITAFSLTGSPDVYGLFVIPTARNASGTAALLSANADFYAPGASVGVSATTNLLTADADFPTPKVKGTAPTQWNTENKPTTIWTPTND